MTEVFVTQIRNPLAYTLPEVQALFDRAFEDLPYVTGKQVVAVLLGHIEDDDLAAFMAEEDGRPVGMMVLIGDSYPLYPTAQIYHFFNEGTPKVRRALIERIMEWMREHGHTEFFGSNVGDKPDSVWLRAFRVGGKGEKVGTIYKFKVKDGNDE